MRETAILRNDRLQVQKIAQFSYDHHGPHVPLVNTPVLMSEACEALLENNPQARQLRPKRAEQDHQEMEPTTSFDVSQIAKNWVIQAAGFTQIIPDGAPAPHRKTDTPKRDRRPHGIRKTQPRETRYGGKRKFSSGQMDRWRHPLHREITYR